MRKTRVYALAAAIAVLALSVAALVGHRPAPLPRTYRNTTYKFALSLPADYTVTEVPSANPPALNAPADIIEVGNNHGNVQLTIEPAEDSGSTLTKESIVASHPYMADVTTEPITIAPGVTGFSVTGGNPSQMSQLWFKRGGYVYQFSAYHVGLDHLPIIARTIALF
jgi:hypothetical protein